MFDTNSQDTAPKNIPFPSLQEIEEKINKEPKQAETFQEGALAGNPKPPAKVISFSDIQPQVAPKTQQDKDIYMDFVREAANNSNAHGIYLDRNGQKQNLKESWFDTFEGNIMGYNDWQYASPVVEDENGQFVSDSTWNPAKGYMRKFDDDQKYAFLYPTYDSEGNKILKEFIGTKAELQASQIAALNTFGPAERSEGFGRGLVKGLSNTVLGTDDLVAGFVKFGTQPSRWITSKLFEAMGDTPDEAEYYSNNSSFAKSIDNFYKDTIADSEQNNYVTSQASENFGSADWLGSGIGSGIGSLLQFGAYGRGIKLATSLAGLGAKKLGFELMKRETAQIIGRYGSSAVMGFGAGYNEAKANGLSDNMSFAFALPVGLINTILEAKFGSVVDNYLIGNSTNIAKELFNETGGKLLDQSAVNKAVNKVVQRISSKITTETGKGVLQDAGEEGLQDIQNQLWRITFNAFLEGNKGEGRFREDSFSVKSVGENTLFGGIVAGPFAYMGARSEAKSYNYNPDNVIDSYVQSGKTDQLVSGLDKLLSKGVITKEQYDQKVSRIQDFKAINDDIVSRKINFGNDFGALLRQEYMGLKLEQKQAEAQKLSVLQTNAEKLSTGEYDVKSLQKEYADQISSLDKNIEDLSAKASVYEKPEYITMRTSQLKDLADAVRTANGFARKKSFFTNLQGLKTKALDKLKKKDISSSPVISTPEELKATVDAIKSGDVDASMLIDADWLNKNPIYLSNLFDQSDLAVLQGLGVAIPVAEQANAQQTNVEQTSTEQKPIAESVKPETIENPETALPQNGGNVNQANNVENSNVENNTNNQTVDQITNDQLVDDQLVDDGRAVPLISAEQQAIYNILNGVTNWDNLAKILNSSSVYAPLIKALDQTQIALNYLSPSQRDLYKKLQKANTNPLSVMLVNKASGKKNGKYIRSLYAAFVQVDTNLLDRLSGKIMVGAATEKEKLDFKKEQDKFFHVLLHESTHGVFDGELTRLHKQAIDGDVQAQRTWQRYVDLASTAYETLKDNKSAKDLYFFSPAVSGKYMAMTGDRQKEQSLAFVHEFFAEALSNEKFIGLLNSVYLDTTDAQMRARIDQHYDKYTDIPPRSTLWNEIVKAVNSVWDSLRDKLSFSDRTLLSEAYALASQLTTNVDTAVEPVIDNKDLIEVTNFDIFKYEPYALFGRGQSLNSTDLAAEIQGRVSTIGLPYDAAFDKKLRASLTKGIGNDFIEGTFKPIFFRSTNTYMVSWQQESDSGILTKRIFIDSWGNLTSINTNVFNTTDPVDFSKPTVYEPFLASNKASGYWQAKREMLNDFDRAHKEDFSGRSYLTYDPDYEFVLGKGTDNERKVRGQVKVNYEFSDGSTAVIGYLHDLAKIKLGRILSSGAMIELDIKVKNGAVGSMLKVKRDSDGNIVDIKSKNDLMPGYELEEGLFPAIDVRYKSTDASQQLVDATIKADSFTHYDEQVPVRINDDKQGKTPEQIVEQVEGNNGFKEVDQPNVETQVTDFVLDDAIKTRIENNKELVFRRARYRRAWFGIEENELNDFIQNTALTTIEGLKKDYLPMYGEQISTALDFFGMSQQDFFSWVNEIHEQVMTATASANQLQDTQDWEGNGFNPTNTISPLIKWDIERLLYRDPISGRDKVMDFSDASDILYDATSFATDIGQVIDNLEAKVNDPGQNIKTRNVALALARNYKKYLSDKLPAKEREVFEKAIPSLLSQMGSYRKVEAIIFQPVENSNGVKGYYPNQSQEFRKVKEQLSQKMEAYITDLKSLAKNNNTKGSILEWKRVNQIFGIGKDLTNGEDKFSATKALRLLNRYFNEDTLVTGLNSKAIYDSLSEKEKLFLSRYVNPVNGLFIDEAGNDGYKKLTTMLTDYLRSIGLEDFPFHLMDRTRIEDSADYIREQIQKQSEKIASANAKALDKFIATSPGESEVEAKKAELAKEGLKQLNRFKRDIRKSTPLYKYHTVTISRNQISEDNKTSSVERTVPVVELAAQIARHAYTSIEKISDGDTTPIGKRLGELEDLAQIIQNYREGSNTPSFYFDASMAKRWSRRIRNYTDDMMEKLTRNIDGLMTTYRNADIHKENNVLTAIQRNNGEAIDVYFAGIKSANGSDGTTYSDMDNGDYIYAQLSGFVTMADKYWHMDKTPSDKPGNYMYKLLKIAVEDYADEIEKIKRIEEVRLQRANLRFNEAFEGVYKKGEDGKFLKNEKGLRILDYYKVKDEAKLVNLVEGADYVFKNGVYQKGRLHDRKKYWYNGQNTQSILSNLNKEADLFYQYLKSENIKIPVSSSFESENNPGLTYAKAVEQGSEFAITDQAQRQYMAALEREQERVVKQWYVNSAINQFHLTMITQGDPLYYKNGVDVSKRMAGARGPIQHHVEKGTFRLASIRDIDSGKTPVMLPTVSVDENGNAVILDPSEKGETNRGDAQGYVTEEFANRLTQMYGSLAGYGQIFKPLLFGVQPQHIEDNRPSYLKLSLFVVPDPYNPKNQKFYTDQPDMYGFAAKLYGDGSEGSLVDVAVFESGIKVGMSNVSSYADPVYLTQEMDVSMLGFQNNPKHVTDDHSDISGLSQNKKISGNMSADKAAIAYGIEAQMIRDKVNKTLEQITPEGIKQIAYQSLSEQNHTAEIAEALKEGLSVDNPVFGVMIENLINSKYASATEYLRLPGNKMVNVSEVGMQRPELTDDQQELYQALAGVVGDRTLRWAGPRKADELTVFQLEDYNAGMSSGIYSLDEKGNILVNKDGKWVPKIFPAEVMVPASMGNVGEYLLATRIPTSGPQSIIPAVIVGHLPDELTSGNTIVSPLEGPGLLGFDFDVDGLFTWRRSGNNAMKKMFDIYFDIFTDYSNYEDITTAISTDTFSSMLYDSERADPDSPKYDPDYNKDRLLGRQMSQFHNDSPATQILYRDLNKSGKKMIGISAVNANIHNVLSGELKKGNPIYVESDMGLARDINIDGISHKGYQSVYTDMETGEVKPIAPIMATMVNLSTDNAKLQLLFRLGLTLENAGIFFDFVLKGVDPKYALYFLNQPIIKEYENLALSEKRVSHKYSGNEAYSDLVAKYEGIVRNLTGNSAYSYMPQVIRSPFDQSDKSISYADLKASLDKAVNASTNDSPLTSDAEFIKQQLLVLEKYRYYQRLSKITSQVGALIRLDSSYPKTFLEAASRWEQILKGFKVTNASRLVGVQMDKTDFGTIQNELETDHPIYKMHYEALGDLISAYSKIKVIANSVVFEKLYPYMNGVSQENQKKIEDSFKNYIVSVSTEYNSSLLGKRMSNYHFVDWSSRVISQVMADPSSGSNEFLKLLSAEIILSPDHDRIINQQVKPSQIKANTIGKEFTKKQLQAIQEGFLSLPTDYQHPEFDQPIDLQKLVVANMLYNKGLGMGGFNITQLLPASVIKTLDDSISKYSNVKLSDQFDLSMMADDFSKQLISNMKFLQREIKANELQGLREVVKNKDKNKLDRIDVSIEVVNRKNANFNTLWDNMSPYRGVWVPQKDGSKVLYTRESIKVGKSYRHYLNRLDAPKHNFVTEFYPVPLISKPETEENPSTVAPSVTVQLGQMVLGEDVTQNSGTDVSQLPEIVTEHNLETEQMQPNQNVENTTGENSSANDQEDQSDVLNYYESVVGYAQRDTPMDDMQLAERVINYRFGDMASQIWSQNSTINPMDVYDPNYINYATSQPYTYQQIIDELMGQYKQEESELFQIADKIDNHNLLGRDSTGKFVTSTSALAALHQNLARNYNSIDGLAKKEFANLFRKVANELVERRLADHIAKNNIDPSVLKNQRDLGKFSNYTTSIAEVSANQAALQAESRRIDTAKYMTDTETNKTVGKLKILLNNVYKSHFASQSDQWHRRFRFWENHKRHNEPFLWLYEKDAAGEYTGRFIQKYVYGTKKKTAYFQDLEKTAQLNTAEGELAKAKLALYEFLETEGNRLLGENEYTNIPEDRAFMPHLGVDMEEAYSRYGLTGAYLAYSGADDYNQILDKVIVSQGSKTQSIGDWRKELIDNTGTVNSGTVNEQKNKIDKFTEILDKARQMVKNGESGLSRYDLEQLEAFESSFAASARIPFRAVMRRKNFSVNTSRILVQHFTQLIFKKHHDPVLVELQATSMHYQMKSKNPKDFENIKNFIDLYGDRYFFGKKDDFSKSKAGKTLEVLSSVTTSSFLGFAPTNALLNFVGGAVEIYKNSIENYGWAEGTTKFGIGMKRLFDKGTRNVNDPSEALPKLMFNPKALALAERFNIENFSQIDTEQEGSLWAKYTKFALQIQRSSEIAVRLGAFLGELTQEQWDNYVLDANGQIQIIDPAIAPKIEDVNRWKYYVSAKQGFYDSSQRYNYSYYGLAKGVMLFKNWMLSFFKERFYFNAKNQELNYADIDRYGRMRQGYYATMALVAKDYVNHIRQTKSVSKFRPLNQLEQQNMRKILFDAGLLVTLVVLGNIGDDDEEEGYWSRFANKLNSQLYFSLTPSEWVKTLKQPTPSLSVVENMISAVYNLATLKAEKAGRNIAKVVPAGNVVEGAINLLGEENE